MLYKGTQSADKNTITNRCCRASASHLCLQTKHLHWTKKWSIWLLYPDVKASTLDILKCKMWPDLAVIPLCSDVTVVNSLKLTKGFAVQSSPLIAKSKLSILEVSHGKKYWTVSSLCDIHLLHSLRKNSKKSLWSLCRNWRMQRRNLDMLSNTSRWVHLLSPLLEINILSAKMWVQRPTAQKHYRPQHSTEAAVEESERIFSKLIRSIEKQSSEVKEVIRVQERAAVSQAEELLEKLQREIVELKRTDAELEKLCRAEDHIYFLQVWNNGWLRHRLVQSCLYYVRNISNITYNVINSRDGDDLKCFYLLES